jgi:hypothetical protein
MIGAGIVLLHTTSNGRMRKSRIAARWLLLWLVPVAMFRSCQLDQGKRTKGSTSRLLCLTLALEPSSDFLRTMVGC